jgi:hypothetical protein
LQVLTLRGRVDSPQASRSSSDLRHLAALQELVLHVHSVEPSMQFQLPAQLSVLTISEQVRLQGRHVPRNIKVDVLSFEKLAGLLQHLSTRQKQPWRLQLSVEGSVFDTSNAGQAGAALEACTSLTCLQLVGCSPSLHMPWSRYATMLRQLRQLDICSWEQADEDLLMLTALTGLTRLALCCEPSDVVAVSLACRLTGLQILKLLCHQLQTASVVPAVASLTDLRHLHLASERDSILICALFTPAVLSALLPLTQLTYLHLPLSASVCPEEAQQQFVAQMPGLSSIRTETIGAYECAIES